MGMLPIWFIIMALVTAGLFMIFVVGLFLGAPFGIGSLICFVLFAVYTGRAIKQIIGYYKHCDEYIYRNFSLNICDRLLYSEHGEKTKDSRERDKRREVRNDEWRCPNCGSVNSNYVGICGCGHRNDQ